MARCLNSSSFSLAMALPGRFDYSYLSEAFEAHKGPMTYLNS